METEFIYWRHKTPIGVKVEEVSGAEQRTGRLRTEMSRQIWCENGKEGYRCLGHFDNGAPFVENSHAKISISHCDRLFVVATLPPTPEADLSETNRRTAMGIDTEPWNREQVMKVRERFLNDEELAMVPDAEVTLNILAWTIKEAALKAVMRTDLDIRREIRIKKLPDVEKGTLGSVVVTVDGEDWELEVYSYDSEGCCVTIALSGTCAKFRRESGR